MSEPLRDKLKPNERLRAYAKEEAVDRLPCVPIVGNTAARVIGARVGEFKGNGKLVARAQVAAYRMFGYDNIRIFTDLYTIAEAMGAAVFYPDDETAYLDSPAINDEKDIASLKPADPQKDGNLPQFLEAMKIALDEVGDEVPVTGALTGPFTTSSFLIGAERLARGIITSPEAVHELCSVALESCLNYAKAIIDIGCTPSLTDPMSSGTVISRKQFQTFSFPYLKKLIDYIHGRGKGVTLHICGNTSKIWDLMADAGADCLSIDNEASLADAKRAVGDRVRLMGNVRPSEIMLEGTQADVNQAVRRCVTEAHDSPKGLVVASGCSLPTETPFENIRAMLNAVREIGWPVNTGRG
ncbi:methylcobamide--CoM methyltransferase [Synergistales bacterium]|nr:methylcobamide--CoM methyltransferase [Synergistales bacterium]